MSNFAPNRFRATTQGATKATINVGRSSLQGYCFVNPNAYAVYVKLYNALAANVTVGTTVPRKVIPIPAAGYLLQEPCGFPLCDFDTGFVIAVTKLPADSDTTALAAPLDLCEIYYT